MMRQADEQTGALQQLCSMILHVLPSPPLPVSFPTLSLSSSSSSSPRPPHISAAAFGLLFLGISVALMLFGSLTFIIGFFLMPLVITLVLLFYIAAIVSNLSEFAGAILWPTLAPAAHDSNQIKDKPN
ncbi:uncharacterized protein LOC127241924 isoform X3 [Andrographis paniculata]|nr:uncharacterized protein LOC127241924 isoform X2 [Andrographis paniculata]XP_051117176.1 uncharacterized protein LOC127241924 isoform X3 [Andrographis paniculata]